MNESIIQLQQQVVDAALGSVRAEGLTPSEGVQTNLAAYLQGDMDLTAVREEALLRVTNPAPSAE